MKAVLTLALLTAACQAQDPLAAGRELTATLKLEQQADAAILRAIGLERSQTLLMAVLGQGQSPSATSDDWKNMHRATDGLIELFVDKGEWFRAAIFASLQDGNYRHYEHDYRSALAASRRALDLQQKSGLTGTLDIPWAAIGRNLMSLGETADALTHFRQAQLLTQNPVSKLAGHNWRDIVQAELALGHKDAAQREVTRFLDQAGAAPPEFRASALLAQTDLLLDQQQYGAVLDVLKQSRQSGVDDYELINQLMSCVLLSMRSLSYAEALALAKRMDTEFTGLPINISAFAQQSTLVRRRMAGDIDGVLREQVAQLQGARAAKSLSGQIETLRGIATSYRASNSISNQIAALEEALELEKTLLAPNGLPANSAAAYSYFRLLNSIGEANMRIREIGKAKRAYEEVTKKIELTPDGLTQKRMASLYGEAVLGKASVAEMDDDADTAREILQKALAGSIKLAQFSRGDVLWQAARLERGQKEFAAANKFYAQTVEAIGGTRDLQYEAVCRIEYAHFLALNSTRIPDAVTLAEHQLKAAQSLAETMNLADGQWRVLYEFGILAEAKQENAGALQLYRKSVTRLEALRAGLTQQEQRQSLVDNEAVQDLYRRILSLLAAAGDTPHAWDMLERAKARSFLESMQGKRFRSAGKPDAALAEIAELEGRIAGLRVQMLPENESTLRGSGREPAVLKNELRQLEAKFALARQQSALSHTRAGQTIAANPVPLDRVRALLPPGTALIEYGLVSDGLVAFVATRGAARQVRWDVKTDALRKDVIRLRAMLADEHSGEEMPSLVKSISERVVAPMIKDLPAGIEQLIIVPAGHLHYLPFQVLEINGRALIEQYTISYLPSASVLAFLGQAEKKNGEIFLGALGKISVEGWAPLAGTLRETGEIARLYPHPARASELEFTHDRARDALLRYDVVHFATHGLLDEQAPLFSALLTAQSAGQPSRLSLYELPDLELRARLVILSACETGLGKLQGGDEVAGLTRTFLLAGANTVVSSLWKVSDDSTALLMQGFHRRLRAGLPPARAMRESAADVRKQFPHPFHWAPFVVTGIQ